jgi:hypothetical protein
MRAFYIVARWLRILFFAFIGSIFVLYVSPIMAHWSATKLEDATQNNLTNLCVLFGLLCVGCLSLVHGFARFRLQQARWPAYPPLPLAVIIAFVLAAIWPSLAVWIAAVPHIEPPIAIISAIGYGVFWLLSASAVAAIEAFRRHFESAGGSAVSPKNRVTLDALTNEQLAAWFSRERPINFPDEDLFGFWEFADSVLQKLWREGNTIALQGGFGAGKTSFIHLLERRAAQRRAPLYFTRVSCWGFEEAIAAQKSVLSTLVKSTNEKVECLSIRHLPNEYVSVASKKFEWLSLFTSIDETPLEQLQRLSPILTAIGRRVVVVVEDVDRAGEKFDISTVFALLAQFREVRNLAFILTISPHQVVDFARLCEFTELLPMPTPSTVALLCQRIRDHLIEMFPDDILVDKVKDLAGTERIDSLSALMMPGVKDWPSSVFQLLRVPRFLKRALRRLSDAWKTLHGEVSIDALLMTCTLREAAPSAFSFLQAELDDLLTAANQTYSQSSEDYIATLRTYLKKRWQAVVDRREFDSRSVEVLIQHLFPGTSFLSELHVIPTILKQGPSGDRAKTYALRLFTERVEVTE